MAAKHQHLSNRYIPEEFLDWLTGFIEGDGCFSSHIPKKPSRRKKAHMHRKGESMHRWVPTPRVQLIIQLGEYAVLYKIKHTLQMGQIRKTSEGYWRYTVSKKQHIALLIGWLNGRLALEKKHRSFCTWVDVFKQSNLVSTARNLLISVPDVLPVTSVDLRKAWLSGLIDREGCFQITLQKSDRYRLGYRTRLRFMIDQKNALDSMQQIVCLFKGSVGLRKPSLTHRYAQTTTVHLRPIVDYLKLFPLKTRKHMLFLRWAKAVEMCVNKQHLTFEGFEQIKKLKHLNMQTVKKAKGVISPSLQKCVEESNED
uniref:Hypothetical LAGLIDADG homing endonuclease n=1 Tax=Bracteacoccus minor TaxID=50037 RepID=A0A076VI03_9CHLO|nr:hypothetical LAGLIDADG homing endonuclease [Bracteacoccus minor]AIK29099.1 hypothetical LAGLIDADG homing endonuclease [Bracteacoccus minor]